ncbi:MAG: DUF664 domain-containing protein [Chloroflexi bacterium]|nr:DUF664 domain-containing protein [Chloroflexota bacterium]
MLPALRDLHANLAWLHDQIKAIVSDLEPSQLDWKPAPAWNSIAQLVAHTADSERYWTGEVVGGEATGRERDAAFAVSRLDAAALCDLLDDALAVSERALENVTPADLDRDYTDGPGGPVTAMGPLAHALEHTAIHTGHIELMRDLLMERDTEASGGGAA